MRAADNILAAFCWVKCYLSEIRGLMEIDFSSEVCVCGCFSLHVRNQTRWKMASDSVEKLPQLH